ncbi:MAG: hypothetical protein HN742_37565 [Lentisphaerae bacterium]|nr:hypothetical protein [Lentisphaerota bacterium]MBT4815555.1 hypothetical protein [Lentisphaerota bacterium]MBT5613212.1 hypothetical protein [Lentisphaerota bacterium]MBT7062125.1 hypothetical protein [Lentisphaerota bacterium]MBT7847637.1 hypothetical protein [Lentisphaerota bacterium]
MSRESVRRNEELDFEHVFSEDEILAIIAATYLHLSRGVPAVIEPVQDRENWRLAARLAGVGG